MGIAMSCYDYVLLNAKALVKKVNSILVLTI